MLNARSAACRFGTALGALVAVTSAWHAVSHRGETGQVRGPVLAVGAAGKAPLDLRHGARRKKDGGIEFTNHLQVAEAPFSRKLDGASAVDPARARRGKRCAKETRRAAAIDFARHSHSGAALPSRNSPTSDSRRTRVRSWKSNGWLRSRSGKTTA